MSKISNKTTSVVWVIGVFAILFSATAVISGTIIQQRNAYGIDKNKTTEQLTLGVPAMGQQFSKNNVPVTLPLIKGYVKGHEVFYITTEASDKKVADHLTNLTGSRVVYAPSLNYAPAGSLANIYEFKNGIKGSGPEGFQPNVADSQPGDRGYSPVWRINLVEWKQGAAARELKSEIDIVAAQDKGELSIKPANVIVNCPFVMWNGGSLKEREDKTLTDETAYGGGQVLKIDTKKNQVIFVAHRGFAPDGSTIYYIATDASVKKVADALGVVFANKTDSALKSGASSDLFVFTNGIKGTGPMGFQASVASTNAGDDAYSPLWRIQATTWKDPSHSQLLTSAKEISAAAADGKLTIEFTGAIVNCPFVETPSSA
jgi:hypothetical protein